MHAPQTRRVLHLLAASTGGIRRHVRYLALNPPDGFRTAGVLGPGSLEGYFGEVDFRPWEGGRSLRSFDADVLHAHGLTAGLRAVRSTMLRPGRPAVVVTVHTSVRQTLRASFPGAQLPVVQRALWRVAKAVIGRADAVIAVSDDVREHFGATDTVPPAVDLPAAPAGSRRDLRAEMGVSPDQVVVLAVGRLHPDKALDVFIDAVRGTGATGWLAGEGPERQRLEGLVEGSGVTLLGQRDDIAALLAAADVFALPTAGESYGLAVLEAVNAGLPVVATRAGAIAEIVGEGGLVVPPGDVTGFVNAVHRVVKDAELRERLARAARGRQLPSPQDLVAQIGRVYGRVSAQPARRGPRSVLKGSAGG